jgi:hypothetical protein
METLTTRRIVASVLLAIGAFWLFLAFVFFSNDGWSWHSLGAAFSFWFVVAAIPFLLAGWALLRYKG